MLELLGLLLLVLNLLDVYLTNKALSLGGSEAWPPMVKIMKIFGKAWPIVKLLVILSAGAYMVWIEALLPLLVANAIYIWVVWNNYNVVKTLSKK